MSALTKNELSYLGEQRLGRIATVGAGGRPHVVPVGFRYNAGTGTIDIGGYNLERTRKFRDVQSHPQVAFVVDSLVSVDPWRPQGIEIRGAAEALTTGGEALAPGFDGAFIRIHPDYHVSWGIQE